MDSTHTSALYSRISWSGKIFYLKHQINETWKTRDSASSQLEHLRNFWKIEYRLRIGLPEYTTARYKQRERQGWNVMKWWIIGELQSEWPGLLDPYPQNPLTWNIPYTPLSSTSQLFKNNQRQPMTNRTSRKTEILKLKDEHTKEEPQSFYWTSWNGDTE